MANSAGKSKSVRASGRTANRALAAASLAGLTTTTGTGVALSLATVAGAAALLGSPTTSTASVTASYWDPGTTGTGTWSATTGATAAWSTAQTGGTVGAWTNGSSAFFSNSAVTGTTYNVALGSAIAATGIEFNTSSAVNISAGSFGINIGTGSIVLDNNAGSATIASTISLGSSTSSFATGQLVNNGTNTLTVGAITTNGLVSNVVFGGSGGISVTGAVGGGTSATEFSITDNDTNVVTLGLATSNFGQVTLNAGTLISNVVGALGTGQINLGASSGSANVTLELKGASSAVYANTIVLGANTGSVLLYAPSFNSVKLTGAISGSNNLSIGVGPNGASVTVAGGVNNTGKLTFVQQGSAANNTGNIFVTSAIGANVNGVTNNTGPFITTLSSAANAYTGFTNVASGILENGVNNALPTGLTLNVTGGNYFLQGFNQSVGTFNGSAGSITANNASSGNSTLTVAGGGTSAGVLQNGSTKTLGLTLSGGTLTLTGASTFTGGLAITGGTVLANASTGSTSGPLGSPTVSVSVQSSAGGHLLTNGAYTIANPIQLLLTPASGTNSIGGNTDNSSTFTGAILMAGNASFTQVATTGTNALNITGGISDNNTGGYTATFAGPGTINVSGGAIANGFSALAVANTGGTTLFAASNSYTGGTTISAGTLRAEASSSSFGTGAVIVNGGVLAGSGTTGNGQVVLNPNGTITAGAGATASFTPSGLTIGTGGLNASGGTYAAKVDLANAAADTTGTGQSTVGTTVNDQLLVTGSLSGSGTVVVLPVAISLTATSQQESFVIATVAGASQADLPGFLSQFSLPGGGPSYTDGAGNSYTLDAAADANSGDDLLLDVVTAAAPEPTSLLLAGIATAPLALRRRRRLAATVA